MRVGLLLECDEQVAKFLFEHYQQPTFKYDKAIGIITDDVLTGAVLFHNWNGSNVEISYYGKGTMSAGIVRCLAHLCIHLFDPARLSAVVSKKRRHLIKSMQRLGWRLEGVSRCYYGKRDCNRNVGVRFVMFRDRLEQLARVPPRSQQEAL